MKKDGGFTPNARSWIPLFEEAVVKRMTFCIYKTLKDGYNSCETLIF